MRGIIGPKIKRNLKRFYFFTDVYKYVYIIHHVGENFVVCTLYNSVTYIIQYPIHILKFCLRDIDDPIA